MVTTFLYTVLLFLYLFQFLLPKSACVGFFPLYDRYLLHFIYDKEEEDLCHLPM